jgi:transcription initiation factor IIE alpha subunit
MPKCPKCGEEIDGLDNRTNAEVESYFIANNGGWGEYLYTHNCYLNDGDYMCPECGEVLFTDEKSALNFLKGIDDEKIV